MGAPRRKISKQERKGRDALMRVANWVHVLVFRRLFDEGWTTEQVAMAYEKIQAQTARLVIARAMPDWGYVDEKQVADEVYATVIGGE